MSSIRYKLQKLLPNLKLEAIQNKDKKVLARWRIIQRILVSRKSILIACQAASVSSDYFYKWANRLLKGKSLNALEERSKVPHHQPFKTSIKIERKVISLRKAENYQGADRISNDLMDFHNTFCPPSTVNAILKRNGLISKKESKKLTKKHLKRYRRPLPGYLQMDFKYVPYRIDGKQFYQLSCIDHNSSWRLIRTYRYKSVESVIAFLEELRVLVPFPIIQIQTDNDTAFTDKYSSKLGVPTGNHPMDQWCSKHEIEHKLIPLGAKELNGKVENSHKQDDREFFSQSLFTTLDELQRASIAYQYRWNAVRRTKAINRLSPNEVVANSYPLALAYLEVMRSKLAPLEKPFLTILKSGDIIHHFKENKKPTKKKIRTKKLSAVNRYLKYLEWDDQNCILILPTMFLNSSQ